MKRKAFAIILLANLALVFQVAAEDLRHFVNPGPGAPGFFYPPPADTFKRMRSQPLRWIEWWEANRDPYLEAIRQGKDLKPDQEKLDKYRKQAVAVLLTGLKSDAGQVRASAALALGRIGPKEAFEPLCGLAKKDKEVQVRQAAIIAVGLLDTPVAEEFLKMIAFAPIPEDRNNFADKPSDRQAALTALGLMSRLSPETVAGLKKAVESYGLAGPDAVVRDPDKKVLANYGLTASPIPAWTLTRPLDPADPSAPVLLDKEGGWNGTVHRLAQGSGLAASAIACWALSCREDPAGSKPLCQDVLNRTNVPWIANEAILSLGHPGDAECAPALGEILLATPKGKSPPVFKMLESQNSRLQYLWQVRESAAVRHDVQIPRIQGRLFLNRKVDLEGWGAYQPAFNKIFERWGYLQLHFSGDDYDAVRSPYDSKVIVCDYGWFDCGPDYHPTNHFVYHIYLGVEPVFQANLRASAAIALGRIDSPASRAALRRVLAEKDDQYNNSYKSMAIMSLGELGDETALPALAELVRPTAPRGVVMPKEKIQSPLRGFAALALGLYARPVKTSKGMVNRPNYDKVCLLLAERLADVQEEQELRAACALALGLSGRSENLKYLKVGRESEDLLIGYVILARGMLGDASVPEAATAFLTVAKERTDMPGILGRRAAVLGLGLIGSPEAISVLGGCWKMSYYVRRETATAMSFCQAFDAAERLAAMMEGSGKPEDRALAARCLGELFSGVRPQRLNWLVNGDNYMMTMRIPRLTLYHACANEFLYQYLLPAFADEWETPTSQN